MKKAIVNKERMSLEQKATLLAELKYVFSYVENRRNDELCNYECIGEEQSSDWKGDLLWEDDEHTIPRMHDVYEYVPKKVLTDEEKYQNVAYDIILEKLAELI